MKECHRCCGFEQCAYTDDYYRAMYHSIACDWYAGTRDRAVLSEREERYGRLMAEEGRDG